MQYFFVLKDEHFFLASIHCEVISFIAPSVLPIIQELHQ